MPAAGDEGYEKLVQCPYDKSHEIRRGRLQFHLDKCRKNFPNSLMIKCPFNSTHLIPKVEEQFHTQEECMSRSNWDSHTHEVGDTNCPVKNLVPVTAGTIPEGDENWDDYETTGSVINTIRAQAEEKTILRMMQCESKAKRKNFRLNERRRIEALRNNPLTNDISENVSVTSDNEPLRRPTRKPYIPVERQDPAAAIAAIDSKYSNKHVIEQFRTLDLDVKKSNYNYMHTETSSMCNGPPSEPSVSGEVNFAATPMNYAAAFKSSSSTPRPASQPATSTAMSSAMSSNVSRPSTAMSVATSAGQVAITEQYIKLASSQEGFCQIPIPGLGRGSARQKVQDKSRKGRPSIAMSIALSAQEGTSAPFLGGANHEQFREMPTSGLGEGSTV